MSVTQASPAYIVRTTFMDSNRAKSEGEWWAVRTIEEIEDKHMRAWDKIEKLETELAKLKRQIREGELIPLDVVADFVGENKLLTDSEYKKIQKYVKQFAEGWQKEGVTE